MLQLQSIIENVAIVIPALDNEIVTPQKAML